ncbi:MAG: hypothetical protein KatS3mg089_0995 [Patescibacteria group bacterium]|nr:MAG: hypothetical protein KatS3mg089_0995 [Patescibacteria group bacterium]
MESSVVESAYPSSFREHDALTLGEHIRLRHSVDLIGMKRVGISNFLRFFLTHEQTHKLFIKEKNHLLIPVDLNDLVEREIYPFWTLTFKRIVDQVEKRQAASAVHEKISSLFLSSIQTNDLFLLMDGVRKALQLLVAANYIPTLFLLRFDRIKDVVTPEFFDNLQGLRDATQGKLAYVFTSFRALDALSPQAFTRADLTAFSHFLYIKPLSYDDAVISISFSKDRYSLSLKEELIKEIVRLTGGHAQYLQLALILLNELQKEGNISKEKLASIMSQDERVTLVSEELWESLRSEEQDVLSRIVKKEKLGEEEKKQAQYIFDVGMVKQMNNSLEVFSPLFAQYISFIIHHTSQKERELVFSKKEHLLFTFLQDHLGEICEREEIIDAVWPEYKEFGVSDWSIDRLVARVRAKLKQQASPFEIRTVRTRGYILTERA